MQPNVERDRMKGWIDEAIARSTEAQIIEMLREPEAGVLVTEQCRRHEFSSPTFPKRNAKFCGLHVSEAKRRETLEEQNSKLNRILADAMLDNKALKDFVE